MTDNVANAKRGKMWRVCVCVCVCVVNAFVFACDWLATVAIMADFIMLRTFTTPSLLSGLIQQPVNIPSSACLSLFSDGYDMPCCKDCLYSNTTGTKCRDADPTNCKDNTYCDGKSPECPAAPSMSDGTRCIDRLVDSEKYNMTSLNGGG